MRETSFADASRRVDNPSAKQVECTVFIAQVKITVLVGTRFECAYRF